MIRDHKLLAEFELRQLARHISFEERLGIAAAMYQHACDCGVFPRKDPLEGLDHVIELTRKIHSVRRTYSPN